MRFVVVEVKNGEQSVLAIEIIDNADNKFTLSEGKNNLHVPVELRKKVIELMEALKIQWQQQK